MKNTIIETATGKWVNVISLSDNWTGAEGEWQIPDGHEFVDGNGTTGFVWNGTQFIDPDPITEEEQAETNWAALRIERNALLASSDWTQASDSPLTDEIKASWATYRVELRELPESADPADPTWPHDPNWVEPQLAV
jgi:hypothetical protein